jgi:hypothetical protein
VSTEASDFEVEKATFSPSKIFFVIAESCGQNPVVYRLEYKTRHLFPDHVNKRKQALHVE